MRIPTKRLIRGALVAAVYTALTLALAPMAFGPIQFRASEALTALPMLLPEAIPGLFVGCILANLLGSPMGPLDVIFGSAATLLAALLTWRLRKWPVIAMIPPVLVNALVVGTTLHITQGLPLVITMAQVGLGQLASCYALGLPLHYTLKRLPGDLLR